MRKQNNVTPMRITYSLFVALITGVLFSCGSVVVISDKEAMAKTKMEMELRDESIYSLPLTPICEECLKCCGGN